MGVCKIGLKVWNKDGYGRREYVQREMYNLKLKWAIGKMKWYTVDIKNSCFSTILSVIIGRDKYISVLFFLNVSWELSWREGSILCQILGPRCLKDLFPYLVWAICQKYAPLVHCALHDSVLALQGWKGGWSCQKDCQSEICAWFYLI